jgi:hypothetical protein
LNTEQDSDKDDNEQKEKAKPIDQVLNGNQHEKHNIGETKKEGEEVRGKKTNRQNSNPDLVEPFSTGFALVREEEGKGNCGNRSSPGDFV